MTKRYYYTCPIKALYMMKEFGVQFMTKHKSNFNGEYFFRGFGNLWVTDVDIDSDCCSLRLIDLLHCKDEDATRFNDEIYVVKESEHIFEPKEGDKGIERNLHSQDLCFYGGKYWRYENEEMQKAPHQQRVDIIIRNNKQFFMPEVEND
jgi:hypothetical protein